MFLTSIIKGDNTIIYVDGSRRCIIHAVDSNGGWPGRVKTPADRHLTYHNKLCGTT